VEGNQRRLDIIRSKPNPDRINLVRDWQADFLCRLLEDCGEAGGNISKERLAGLYEDYRPAYEILDISFQALSTLVRTGRFPADEHESRWKRKNRQKHSGQKYCRNRAHGKKNRTLSPKEAWRIHTGLERDRKKCGGGRKRSAGWWFKRYAAKRLRTYFRRQLREERRHLWDALVRGTELRKFPAYDPWIWD
jgi:hypothetical protein